MKKILFVLCIVLLFNSVCVFANEESDYQEALQQQEQMNTDYEYDIGLIVNDTLKEWPIPEYDKTGMTDIEIMRKNYYYYYLAQQGKPESYLPNAKWAVENINEDGSFPGYDYWDYDGAASNTMGPNFNYIRALYMAYITPNQEFYMDDSLVELIERNLKFYHDTVTRKYEKNKYMSVWWNYTIGIPLNLMPALALVQDVISDDIFRAMIVDFLYMPEQMEAGINTGQNAVWYAEQAIFRGAMLNDEERIEQGMEVILRETRMVSMTDPVSRELIYNGGAGVEELGYVEGIQPDESYFMHGPQFYATYGNNTIQDFSMIATICYGTRFEPKERYETVYNSIVDGWLWGTRGNEADLSMYGRTIADKRSTPPGVDVYQATLEKFKYFLPEKKEEIDTILRYWLKADDPQRLYFTGTKYFWRADYLAHHRRDYSVFLKLNSNRTTAMEHNNSQAEKACWVGFGNTFLTKDNYDSPTPSVLYWDWTLIPGMTAEKRIVDFNMSGFFQRQTDAFVGGVSDGEYGAAAERLSKIFGTSAYKSWFFFDDEYVMLGSGISSSGKEPVNTAIDQRFLTGDVEVNGKVIQKGERELTDVKTVLHNGVGFVFPNEQIVGLKNMEAVGNYSEILHSSGLDRNDYKADMFVLYVSHGKRPSNGEYSVVVVPSTDREELAEYSENIPVRIISNTKKLQAVYHDKLNMGYAVFYSNGEVKLSDSLSIKTDSACMLMARNTDEGLKISVSNPYNYKTIVNIIITLNGKEYELRYDLPKYDEDGYNLGGIAVEKIIK